MTLIIDSGYTTTFADADVQAYLTAVETADNQALEYPVAVAIDEFVRGCKADGIWTAIKAFCILAGARTRQGALVPLVNASGVAPTFNGTVGGWSYNRKTSGGNIIGLAGNGTDNFVDSGRNNNAEVSQDAKHMSVYVSTLPSVDNTSYIGMALAPGSSHLSRSNPGTVIVGVRVNSSSGFSSSLSNAVGLIGVARSSASEITIRSGALNQVATLASASPANGNLLVFDGIGKSNARLAAYSIGENLNLALLDARVTALITAIGAAIP